ncbi:unnamed protein product [Rangifer tarandus platyrhynchus]|uniref:Uncharacterized protein n=1 Tax=Rangifer tarandus platyrhynchus TaxID=3082113 RepID=A0ACB1MK76_RANTA
MPEPSPPRRVSQTELPQGLPGSGPTESRVGQRGGRRDFSPRHSPRPALVSGMDRGTSPRRSARDAGSLCGPRLDGPQGRPRGTGLQRHLAGRPDTAPSPADLDLGPQIPPTRT